MAKGQAVNGLRIAQARLALPGAPNQREFAERIGIHWVTQSNIENGKAKVSLELLEKIAKETGRTRDWLQGEDEAEDEEAASMPSQAETDLDRALHAFAVEKVDAAVRKALLETESVAP